MYLNIILGIKNKGRQRKKEKIKTLSGSGIHTLPKSFALSLPALEGTVVTALMGSDREGKKVA